MGLFFTDTDKRIDSLLELLDAERERCARAEGQLDVTREQLVIAQNNFEWARVRLNQVEAERSQYLAALIRLPIQPVQIDRAEPAPPPIAGGMGMPMTLGFDFEDVGDDAAQRMGIDHDGDGGLRYRN